VKLSELTAAFQKVQSVAGDVDVVLKDVGSEAKTVIKSIGLHIDPSSGQAGGTVELEHGAAEPEAPPAPPAAAPEPPA
jgi:hypothetical protein